MLTVLLKFIKKLFFETGLTRHSTFEKKYKLDDNYGT